MSGILELPIELVGCILNSTQFSTRRTCRLFRAQQDAVRSTLHLRNNLYTFGCTRESELTSLFGRMPNLVELECSCRLEDLTGVTTLTRVRALTLYSAWSLAPLASLASLALASSLRSLSIDNLKYTINITVSQRRHALAKSIGFGFNNRGLTHVITYSVMA